jgi:hypothetical protein
MWSLTLLQLAAFGVCQMWLVRFGQRALDHTKFHLTYHVFAFVGSACMWAGYGIAGTFVPYLSDDYRDKCSKARVGIQLWVATTAALIQFSLHVHLRRRVFALHFSNMVALYTPYYFNHVMGYAPYNHQMTWHVSKRRWVRDAVKSLAGGGTEAEAEAYLFWIDVAASVAQTTAVQFILPWIIARRVQRAYVTSLPRETPEEGALEEAALETVWGNGEDEKDIDTDAAAVTMRQRVADLLHAFLASKMKHA